MPDIRKLTGICKLITDDSMLEGKKKKKKNLQDVILSRTISWTHTLNVAVQEEEERGAGVEWW